MKLQLRKGKVHAYLRLALMKRSRKREVVKGQMRMIVACVSATDVRDEIADGLNERFEPPTVDAVRKHLNRMADRGGFDVRLGYSRDLRYTYFWMQQ